MLPQKKVLIIEDEKSIRESLKIKFERENIEVYLAEDGDEGFTLAIQKHPDLILLDILMPNVDGLTFLKNLRTADIWGKTAQVIILTNFSDEEKEKQAKELNVVDYIIKTDWKLEDLADKVRHYLT